MLRRFLIFFLILGLFAFPAQVAQAAAITVDGACTLADAISAANSDSAVGGCAAGSGADVITLDGDVSLTSPLPDVVSTITIEGNGHVIARTGGPAFRLFTIVNGDLTINRVTLTGGHETSDMLSYYDNGSAVYMASGAFTLQNSTVTGNLLDGGVFSLGAALMASSGNMTILDSTIVNNVVNLDDGELGAGVASFDSLVMYRSIVSGNTYNGAPVQVETFAYTGGDNIFGQEGDAGVVDFTPGPTDIVPTGATSTIYGAYAAGIHPLVAGSPALDAASSGPAVDQLGVTRPEGSAYDIGAAEYPENHPPTAHTGTLFAIQDATLCTPHIVPIMQGFDIDPYEEDLVFIILTSVQHGSIIFDPPTVGAGNEGSWISGEACYTPNPGFVGTDFFTYQVSDGLLSSAIATTTLLVGAVNTPTPTATNTAEATVASTPTATATNTTEPTATATATATPTATATDTPEPTATPTATATPTPTATPTATATATATPLPTVTSTATATDTPEPTATPTATATSTPTATPTATATDTPEPTATPTATLVPNNPPDCTTAYAEPALLWPPNHAMQPIMVLGVTDPESQPLTFVVNSVWQDEPTDGTGDGDTAVDATLAPLVVRAERSGNGNGRVYHITLTASDSAGGSCTTEVQVGVPHSKKKLPVDGGALYDSTN